MTMQPLCHGTTGWNPSDLAVSGRLVTPGRLDRGDRLPDGQSLLDPAGPLHALHTWRLPAQLLNSARTSTDHPQRPLEGVTRQLSVRLSEGAGLNTKSAPQTSKTNSNQPLTGLEMLTSLFTSCFFFVRVCWSA